MKNIIFILLVLFAGLSCTKSNNSTTVTYEIIPSNNGVWSNTYNFYSDSAKEMIAINGQNNTNSWKFSFSIPNGLKTDLYLSAIPDTSRAILRLNIYISGKVVANNDSTMLTHSYQGISYQLP
jgi:hypothetical protein